MKILMTFFVGLALFISQEVSAASFDEASAAYREARFQDAVKAYEGLAASTNPAPEVYYNLGNAYFRLGQKAKALLNYERARRLTPRDASLNWNKNILESQLVDRINSSEPFVLREFKKGFSFIAMHEISILLALGLTLFFVLSLINRRWAYTSLLLVVFLATLFSLKWKEFHAERVVIHDKEVAVRFGPSSRETQAFLLHEGTLAKLTDETLDWYHLTLDNGSSGWVPKPSVERI